MLQIIHFYHFAPFPHFAEWREPLRAELAAAQLRGSVLIADEGINGSLCGTAEAIQAAYKAMRSIPGFEALDGRSYPVDAQVFKRLKVRLKKEIVTMGASYPWMGGHYADSEAWDALIDRDDVLLVDTRNDYEYQVGHFKGAINPDTNDFGEFPEWVKENLAQHKDKTIAIYCTGGIRCEKAGKMLQDEGFNHVIQLHGGILSYMKDRIGKPSLWQGDCFVFDDRVAVDADLKAAASICGECHQPYPINKETSYGLCQHQRG